MNNREDAHKSRLSADLPRFFIVGAIFLALALFLRHEISGNTLFQIQELRAWLLGDDIPGGLWMSGAIFLLSSGLLTSLGIPRLWVCGVAGAVYGAGLGSLLSLGGSLIGAITVYLLGRSLLAGMVQRRFAGHLASWGFLLQDNGFWLVFYSRLFPFTNSTVNSLLCGSCRVPVGQYLAGSFLGFIPLTLTFANLGSGGSSGNMVQMSVGFALLGVFSLYRKLTKKTFFPHSR